MSAAGQGSAESVIEVRQAYRKWLESFLPQDYYDRYNEYRWDLALRRAYQEASYEAGWLQPSWTPEHGGREYGPLEAMAIRTEAAQLSAPKLLNIAGPNVAAVGIREFGTPEQIQRYLEPLLRGHEWWALGMSEPSSGSDFAGLRTKAERHGDVYRVNGQKIWTTLADVARWACLYVRTDPDAPKHKGISCLVLDLQAPGVTVRPIRMASISDETFCEVFLDDVEVPVSALLGAEGQGWNVAMTALDHERDMIWIMNWVEITRGLQSIKALDADLADDVASDLGALIADAEALRATGYRALGDRLAGEPALERHILKLMGSEAVQRIWELSAAARGALACIDSELAFDRHDALAATIYGGTSEIQRNIIGERVLGLPRA